MQLSRKSKLDVCRERSTKLKNTGLEGSNIDNPNKVYFKKKIQNLFVQNQANVQKTIRDKEIKGKQSIPDLQCTVDQKSWSVHF